MKLIPLILLLFLIISINSESSLDAYSIDQFIKYLKDNALFEIIESIKMIYGQDVAIISCEELNENYNGNCKKLVTEYMPPPNNRDLTRNGPIIVECKNLNFWQIIKISDSIFDLKKDILRRKYNKNEATIIYNKIKKRTGNLPFCHYSKIIFNE